MRIPTGLFGWTIAAALTLSLSGCGDGDDTASGSGSAQCGVKTVSILVSSEPGAPVDTMARTLAEALGDVGFEPSVVVETRTGGSGAVALSSLVGGPADGATLYAMTRSQAVLFAGEQVPGIDPKSLDYLTRLQDDPYVWAVRSDSDFQTMEDLIAYAQDNPGQVTVGGFGSASAHHLSALTVSKDAGITINWVPYEGGSGMVSALLGGFIDVANANPGQVLELVRAGDVRVLGVSSELPIDGLPEAPTFRDVGIDYVGSHWRGIVAKAGMPQECRTELEAALTAAYESEAFQDLLVEQMVSPGYMPSNEFEKYVLEDVTQSESLLAEAGL